MTRIAFAGVGTMGRHLIRHLVSAGHDVCVFDPVADSMAYAASIGANASSRSVAEACVDAEVCLLSLPSPALVGKVAREAAAALPRGTLLADLSTSPPSLAEELAREIELIGLLVADCPVSGGPIGAKAGTLSAMIGGSDEAFARLEPIAQAFSAYVVHVGTHGTGQAAKLCNNLLAGTHMAALCLALTLARRSGVDDTMLFEILSRSTGDSRVLHNRYPAPGIDDTHPANRDFAALFTLDLMTKDMELATEFAESRALDASLLEAVTDIYHEAQAAGLGSLDYSGLIRLERNASAEATR